LIARIFLCCAVLLAALSCGTLTASSESIARDKIPSWAELAAIPDVRPERYYQTVNGIYWQVSDYQVHWDGSKTHRFFRSVVKALDREGLERTASIDIEFDPSNKTLVVHHIKVIRDGIEIDHTMGSSFTVLRREKELESGIVDGTLTAHSNLRDFRVGDTLDLAYTITVSADVFGPFLATARGLEYNVPVGLERFQVSFPQDADIRYRAHALDISPEISISNGLKKLSWALHDQDPIPSESNRPESYALWGFVEATSWKSWSDIGAVIQPHYEISAPLPDQYLKMTDEIARTYPDPDDRITEVLRIVQDQIRYVGIEIGSGGYVPRQPDIVVERGYGDCKDKALLMVAMLRHLGIEAAVALVNTRKGGFLDQRLPSPYAFNHAIVRTAVGNTVYWLDPTLTHQGGRGGEIVQADYGFALVLDPADRDLQKIPVQLPVTDLRQVEEHFTLPAKAGDPMRLNVTSTYRQIEADQMRQDLAKNGLASKARSYVEYYDDYFRGIKPTAGLQVEDDLDSNSLVIREIYELPFERFNDKRLLKDFRVRAETVLNILPEPEGSERTAPMALPYPGAFAHSIRIYMPYLKFEPLEEVNLSNNEFSLRRNTRIQAHVITTDWKLDILKPDLPAKSLDNYIDDLDEVFNEGVISYNLTRFSKVLEDRKPIATRIKDGIKDAAASFQDWIEENKTKATN